MSDSDGQQQLQLQRVIVATSPRIDKCNTSSNDESTPQRKRKEPATTKTSPGHRSATADEFSTAKRRQTSLHANTESPPNDLAAQGKGSDFLREASLPSKEQQQASSADDKENEPTEEKQAEKQHTQTDEATGRHLSEQATASTGRAKTDEPGDVEIDEQIVPSSQSDCDSASSATDDEEDVTPPRDDNTRKTANSTTTDDDTNQIEASQPRYVFDDEQASQLSPDY